MFHLRTLFGLFFATTLAVSGCGSGSGTADTISSPVSEWCTDPPRDSNGNAVMTLVRKPDASLPPQMVVKFNDQDPVTFVDDGTGLDTKAGDGIYTRAAKIGTTPTEHSCNAVAEGASGQSLSLPADYSAVEQEIGISGNCKTVECPKTGCMTLLGGSTCIICFRCDIMITF